jgi:hypothetical protein
MFIILTEYFEPHKRFSIDVTQIHCIREYGNKGSLFEMKERNVKYYSKESIEEVTELINAQCKLRECRINIYHNC